jgi:hypothetical protein
VLYDCHWSLNQRYILHCSGGGVCGGAVIYNIRSPELLLPYNNEGHYLLKSPTSLFHTEQVASQNPPRPHALDFGGVVVVMLERKMVEM